VETKLTITLANHLIALLVHRAMMSPAQHGEIRQLRRPALSPMMNVMSLAKPHPAARKPAAAVAMV
jgi:hypothetical protein